MLYHNLFSLFSVYQYQINDSLGIDDDDFTDRFLTEISINRWVKSNMGSYRIRANGNLSKNEILGIFSQLKLKTIDDYRLGSWLGKYPSLVLATVLLRPDLIRSCSVDIFQDWDYLIPVARDLESLSFVHFPDIARSGDDDYPIFHCPEKSQKLDRSPIRPVNRIKDPYDPYKFETYQDRSVLNSDGRKRNRIRIQHKLGSRLEFQRIGDQYSYLAQVKTGSQETLLQVMFDVVPNGKHLGKVFLETIDHAIGSTHRVKLGGLSLDRDRIQLKTDLLSGLRKINAIHASELCLLIGIHLGSLKETSAYTLRRIPPNSGFTVPMHWSKIGVQIRYSEINQSLRVISMGIKPTRQDPVTMPSQSNKPIASTQQTAKPLQLVRVNKK